MRDGCGSGSGVALAYLEIWRRDTSANSHTYKATVQRRTRPTPNHMKCSANLRCTRASTRGLLARMMPFAARDASVPARDQPSDVEPAARHEVRADSQALPSIQVTASGIWTSEQSATFTAGRMHT